MPHLSVIIPVYNSSEFLGRSIESVLNQTFRDLELILVDDGSTDNSLEICRDYEQKDSRVKVIHKENGGAGPARNAGIDIAKGNYLAFPDSDDYLELNTYEICMNKLSENDVDLLVFGVKTNYFDDESGRVLETRLDSIPELYYDTADECRVNYVNLHKSMNMNAPWNKIYKNEIVKNSNLRFPDLRRMQDCVFNMFYFDKISSFCSISDNLFVRTWHSNEVQSRKMPKSLVNCMIAYHKTVLELMTSWGEMAEENELFFDDYLSETLLAAEFQYTPEKKTFIQFYKHCRRINNNPYIHSFYKKYRSKKRLIKRESAVYRRMNILIALYLTYSNLRNR